MGVRRAAKRGEETVGDTYDVIMAAYQSTEAAQKDFDALVKLVEEKKVRSEGVILVERDADGEVHVSQTGDHLGRKGLGWGGGVGVLVGLAAPPLLASVAVGAAAGGIIGKFMHHKVESGMESGLGEKLKPGTAAIIAMVDDEDRLAAERALPGTPAKSVVTMDKKGVRGLKDALAEAALKFVPDRTVLPIPDPRLRRHHRSLTAHVGGRLDDRHDTDAPRGRPQRAARPYRRRRLRQPEHVRRPHRDAEHDARRRGGPHLRPLPRDGALLADARGAAHRPQPPHRVGFGSVGEFPGPFPGLHLRASQGLRAVRARAAGQRLLTGGFGKWHLTPDHVQGMAGPYDRWPNAWGFDHFWGFLTGESGQYDPVITQDNTIIGVPEGEEGAEYYVPDDLTDKCVGWLHAVRAQDPSKPWFAYYSTGCSHAPHQVGPEWSDKYKGKFDGGWDAYREETFARQKKLGVDPADAELTPRPAELPAWDSLSADEKKLYARQMEVYAGYSANADWNVGRLLDAVEEMGELEDTLVIYIWGDNGASLEGTLTGSFNELTMLNGIPLTPEQQLSLIDQHGGLDAWGTDATAPHYAAAWAWAGNCPFQWGKQVASHLGGTRNGMVVAWPRRIGKPATCHQFTHCIDIGPTILEAAGIPEAKVVDGVAQTPMEGTSFLYSIDDPTAAERHTQQYFEIFGNRAMYKDGWWACAKLDRKPWDVTPPTMARFAPDKYDPEDDIWELYYLPDDFSQAKDLAAEKPEKLAELKQLFWEEAEKHKVLPLLAGFSVFFGILPPMPTATKRTFYGDVENVLAGMLPRIYGHSYAISADLHIPEGGAEGVIVAEADDMGGFSLFVKDGKLRHTYSFLGVEVYRQESSGAAADRRCDRPHPVRCRRGEARHRRRREPVGRRPQGRRGPHGQDRAGALLGLRRHGHRARQRPAGRPRSLR